MPSQRFSAPLRLIFVVSLLSIALSSQAASFDCAKAKTKVEKLICGHKELSILDEQLHDVYHRLLTKASDKAQIRSSQRHWLKAVRNPCTNVKCLASVYIVRISALKARLNAPPGAYVKYTQAHSYVKIEKGQGVAICTAFKENLDSCFPNGPHISCPPDASLGFSEPDWTWLPVSIPLDSLYDQFGKLIWNRDVNKGAYFKRGVWKNTLAQNKQAYKEFYDDRIGILRGQPASIAKFDIDNDGKPDIVYREHNWSDYLAIVTPDGKHIDRKKTEALLMPHPPFAKMGYGAYRPVKLGDWGSPPQWIQRGYAPTEDAYRNIHYRAILYKGHSYFTQWWGGNPNFHGKSPWDVGRLRLYEATPTGTHELCTYRFTK